MCAITHLLARKCCDAHGAFPLTIDLNENWAKMINCLYNISQIHRATCVNDGSDACSRFPVLFGDLRHAFDHRGGGKHMHIAKVTGQFKNFTFFKTT